MVSLERLVLFVSLVVSVPQSSLLHTPFEIAIHELKFDRILYVLHLYLFEPSSFALCASLISFELSSFALCASFISLERYNFALCASLRFLEHGGGFVLKKLLISHASLKLF